ncbi:MAG: DinB family protein [Desulfovibrionaceae bacterium]|nr:DinB family protein [Desulfovibrionaceae bacterium]
MSQSIIDGQRAAFEHAYGLMAQFIEVCPEDVWAEKFGGWPVWQQVYHALGACQFFVLQDGEIPEQGLYPPEVNSLQSTPSAAPLKKDVLAYAARMKATVDAYLHALRDADLPGVNQGLTARMVSLGKPHALSHSQTLVMLAGHILYHLGSCDAALRERGLKGVF